MAAPSTKACSRKYFTVLPEASTVSSFSRMARSTRPQGARRARSISRKTIRTQSSTSTMLASAKPSGPRSAKARGTPPIPRTPLVSHSSFLRKRRTISAMPMVAMAR